MQDWPQRVVLITGASRGLGLHLAGKFAQRSARLVLVARQPEQLFTAAAGLGLSADRCLILPADVTDDASVASLFAQINQHFGQLDVLVNCAGASQRGLIAQTPLADFERLWRLNVLGVVRMCQGALPLLTVSQGTIVNIGSLAGKLAARYLGAYCATKHALAGLSQQMRLELAPTGVRVLHVCPGPIRRDDAGARYAEQGAGLPPQASKPGAGVKLSGMDPAWLAEQIVRGVEKRQPELVFPWRARLLMAISALAPRWGDWLIGKMTSGPP
ncbi:MAG: SDR family NAD(P)-dependent oxidoreductase [Pirellulales bacterium]|nr:SDR family NAD(P)-dependent oxidoreductase [Pirellulales bacterium]